VSGLYRTIVSHLFLLEVVIIRCQRGGGYHGVFLSSCPCWIRLGLLVWHLLVAATPGMAIQQEQDPRR